MRNKRVPLTIKSILIAALISIGIGTIFITLSSDVSEITFADFLWNIGYSTSLGLSLFANGFLFQGIEEKYISWVKAPVKSLFVAFTIHLVYSSFVIFFINWLWYIAIMGDTISHFLTFGKAIIIGEYIVLIIITTSIYAKSFLKEYRQEAIEGERLKQEAISLQYQIMQNQVNPHFLFNTLNILGSLIDIDKDKAKQFTRELSLFYRELLQFKDKELVSLQEELHFVNRYIYLQKIRFEQNFDVDIRIKEDEIGEVIPMSIQMMVENCIKHNIIAKDKPLKVIIAKTNSNEIYVENNIQLKGSIEDSSKIGLRNLSHRYEFLTNKKIIIESNSSIFKVTFPLVKIEN